MIRPTRAAKLRLPVLPWALPAALSMVIGLTASHRRPLWRDELATWEFSRLSFGDLIHAVRHVDGTFAPYYVLMDAWRLLLPDARALRLPSLLAGAATVAVLAALGGRLWSQASGCAAGVVLATNGAFVDATITARPYALAALCCAAAGWQLLSPPGAISEAKRSARYGLAMVVAVALQLFAVLVLLAHAVVLVLRVLLRPPPRSVLGFVLGAGSAVLAAVLLLALSSGQRAQISWVPATNLDGVRDGMLAALGISEPIWGLLPVAASVFVVLACRRRRELRESAGLAVGLLLVPPVALLAVSLLVQPAFVPRYLFSVPLGAALLLGATGHAVRAEWRPVAAALIAALAVGVQLPGLRDEFSGRTPDEYPRLVRSIAALVLPGDSLVLGQNYNAEGAAVGVAYFLPDPRLARIAVHRLPDGAKELLVARVASTSPWRTTDLERPHGRTLLVGLIVFDRNNGHPDGYAELITLGCRPVTARPRQDVANYGLQPMRCP